MLITLRVPCQNVLRQSSLVDGSNLLHVRKTFGEVLYNVKMLGNELSFDLNPIKSGFSNYLNVCFRLYTAV